jgi:hypothetical protein
LVLLSSYETPDLQRQSAQGKSSCSAISCSNAAIDCAKVGDRKKGEKALTFYIF